MELKKAVENLDWDNATENLDWEKIEQHTTNQVSRPKGQPRKSTALGAASRTSLHHSLFFSTSAGTTRLILRISSGLMTR